MTDTRDSTSVATSRVDRRTLLRGAAFATSGIAAAALFGCGGDDDSDGPASGTPAGTGTATPSVDGGGDNAGVTTDAGRFIPYRLDYGNAQPKSGGTIRLRDWHEPGPLDPTVSASGGTLIPANAVYEPLIGSPSGPDVDPFVIDQLDPGLAASWETTPDGLTHTFAIQPGISWQNVAPLNGRPFMAVDAAFSLNRSAAEGVHRQYFSNVDTITAANDQTLVIKLKQPQPDFLYPLAGPFTGIYPRELVDDGTISTRAIGTGPLVLETWSAPIGGDFVRNPDYWRGPIHIERFEDRAVRDQSAALAMQRSGQIDYGWWVTTEQDFEAVLSTNPDMQYRTSPVFGGGFVIAMNLDLPKWSDERVRRALSLAVDRETIKSVIYGSLGRITALPDWQFFWDEEPTQESGRFGDWWRYAPDEARALLDAAGMSNFSFDMLYYPGYNNGSTIELMIDQLRNSGITMSPRSVEGTEFNLQWTARKGDVDAFDGWSAAGSTAEHYVLGLHHSASPGNRYRINDPQIDGWAEQHQVELDPDVRRELAQHVWERVHDQVYYVTRAIGLSIQLLQPHVRGLNSWSSRIGSGAGYIDTGNNLRSAWLDG